MSAVSGAGMSSRASPALGVAAENAEMRRRIGSLVYGPVCGHEYTTRIASARKRARSGTGEIGMASESAAMPPRTGTSSVDEDPAAKAAAGRDSRTEIVRSAGAVTLTNHVNHF